MVFVVILICPKGKGRKFKIIIATLSDEKKENILTT